VGRDSRPQASWGGFERTGAGALDLCEFDRRPHDLSPHVFEAEYLAPSRPIVVVRGADGMRAKRLWTRERFFSRFGGAVCGLQKLPTSKAALIDGPEGASVPLGTYFARVQAGTHHTNTSTPPLAFNNPRNASLWAEAAEELAWPAALRVPRLRAHEGHYGLFVGSRRSGISMHHHKAAWNALLFGRKLWILTPPRSSRFRREELAATSFEGEWFAEAEARTVSRAAHAQPRAAARADEPVHSASEERRYCVQREGDVLYVPAGWGHSTINLRESVGVAHFFDDDDAAGYRPNKMFHATPGMRSLQTAAGITSPSDHDRDGHP
jgi:hypothetical protein